MGDRQHGSNIQYQQKIGSNDFAPHIKKNMKFIRERLFAIKGRTYSRKNNVVTDRGNYHIKNEVFQMI
jgi:hypothetical protein